MNIYAQAISGANRVPSHTLYSHGLVKLGHGSPTELDEHPAAASSRLECWWWNVLQLHGLRVGCRLFERYKTTIATQSANEVSE